MNSTQPDSDELRGLVREALLEMLQQGHVGDVGTGDQSAGAAPQRRQRMPPPEREIQLTFRGSERSILMIEEALRSDVTSFEITLGPKWGPKVRVRVA